MVDISIERNPDPASINWTELLAHIHSAFAFMDGRIDPPSSLHRLTPELLRDKARAETILVARHDGDIVGCMFCREEGARLYVGKIAVVSELQGTGIGRRLFETAFKMARERGMAGLELETRIELTENHQAFAKLGFRKSGESAHVGYDQPTSITMQADLPGFDDDEGLG